MSSPVCSVTNEISVGSKECRINFLKIKKTFHDNVILAFLKIPPLRNRDVK